MTTFDWCTAGNWPIRIQKSVMSAIENVQNSEVPTVQSDSQTVTITGCGDILDACASESSVVDSDIVVGSIDGAAGKCGNVEDTCVDKFQVPAATDGGEEGSGDEFDVESARLVELARENLSRVTVRPRSDVREENDAAEIGKTVVNDAESGDAALVLREINESESVKCSGDSGVCEMTTEERDEDTVDVASTARKRRLESDCRRSENVIKRANIGGMT